MSFLHIDGSQGEAGGQIIRTALALSALTKQPFTIEKIRHNRPQKGLKQQHLTAVRQLQKLTQAHVEGAHLGSEHLMFTPTKNSIPKELSIDIGTAGSITLLLQALLPVLTAAKHPSTLHIKGGTDVAWSPPIDYACNVFFPLLSPIAEIHTTLHQRGCYPKGGGHLTLKITPRHPTDLCLDKKGNLLSIQGNSFASKHLQQGKVAERTAQTANQLISNKGYKPQIRTDYADSASPGSTLTLWAQYEHSILAADTQGKKGLPAEQVGKQTAQQLLSLMDSEAATDPLLADQLIPYLGLYKGTITTTKLTEHTKTNIAVTELFLKKKFNLEHAKLVRITVHLM